MIRVTISLLVVIAWAGFSLRHEFWDWSRESETPQPAEPVHRPANLELKLKPLTIVVRGLPHMKDPEKFNALAKRFADQGVKRVWLQIKQDETDEVTGGLTFFPNDIAPVVPGFEDDRFGRFVQILTAHQIDVFAWQPLFHDPTANQLHPDWKAYRIGDDGIPRPQQAFVCPARPEAVRYQAAISRAVMKRYPDLKGLYLDFIRYDDDHSCACDACLASFARHLKRDRVAPAEILAASLKEDDQLWTEWVEERARRICGVIEKIRATVEEVRPGCWIGASVLPFSFNDYVFDTQSGQDYYEMARVNLNEIVVMGYWDDWDHSPAWLAEGLSKASELTTKECRLSCLLDGDMHVRKTRLTLQALDKFRGDIGFFLYGEWTDDRLGTLNKSVDGYLREGDMPHPDLFDVVIRIDTEPDSEGRYDTINSRMIEDLTALFKLHDVPATFVTCGKLAELQPDSIREAQRQGHEIACHAYDHESLNKHPDSEQVRIIDQGLEALKRNGLNVVGFGAPRNSLTEPGINRLIDLRLEYDGSLAYDPLKGFQPVDFAEHTRHPGRIVQVPFIMPNDWDARYEMSLSAPQMLKEWKTRFVRVMESGEPCFVLDIHQWIACHPDNLKELAAFIRYVKRNSKCRFVTLRTAAAHARQLLLKYEGPEPALVERRAVHVIGL